jgi:CDP-diacylglycerol--serine O-phosphatidyltransferase
MSDAEAGSDDRRRKRGRVRRRRRKVDLRKAMFVLPNLFTLSNVFCGFYSITLCLGSAEPVALYRAAIAIFFGMFFDMADGRVARLTRTQSEFGVQLDSLADVVAFGVAPSILLYRWCLYEWGFGGALVAFLFLAGGALRLARFNVMAASGGSTKDFVGLPIPLAAGTVVAMVMAAYPFETPSFGGTVGVAVVTVLLALLMVSTVRYRAFKNVRPDRRTITVATAIMIAFVALAAQLKPAIALALLFLGYIGDGLLEEVIFFRRRREEREAARGPTEDEPGEATR